MGPIYFGEDFSPGTPAKKIPTSKLISGHVVAFNSANTFSWKSLFVKFRDFKNYSRFWPQLEVGAFLN